MKNGNETNKYYVWLVEKSAHVCAKNIYLLHLICTVLCCIYSTDDDDRIYIYINLLMFLAWNPWPTEFKELVRLFSQIFSIDERALAVVDTTKLYMIFSWLIITVNKVVVLISVLIEYHRYNFELARLSVSYLLVIVAVPIITIVTMLVVADRENYKKNIIIWNAFHIHVLPLCQYK